MQWRKFTHYEWQMLVISDDVIYIITNYIHQNRIYSHVIDTSRYVAKAVDIL
jgi:hypothetical protein